MTRPTRRGPWLPEEDQTLLQLVCSQGPNNWVRISQHMQHRSPKQCRERYHQNLKPSLNHEPISSQEGELIEQMVNEMGKRWAEIARRLGNRSDNAVKNWWNGSMNRRKRHVIQHGHALKGVGPRTQPIPLTKPSKPLSNHPEHRRFHPSRDYQYDLRSTEPAPYAETLPRPMPLSYPVPPLTNPAHFDHSKHESGQGLDRRLPSLRRFNTYDSMFSQYSSQSYRPGVDPASQSHSYSTLDRPGPPSLQLPASGHHDAPLISPAVTEASQAPSLDRAPSLVSDDQSNCSISPKTVPSPRPDMPAPIDTRVHPWTERPIHRSDSAPHSLSEPRRNSLKLHLDEGYASAIPHSGASDSKIYLPLPEHDLHRRPSFDYAQPPHYHAASNSTGAVYPFAEQSPTIKSPQSARDTRMHLSNLLG